MAAVQEINDASSAAALADLLNGGTRRRPVVVVTIPAGRHQPWIDVGEIAREAGDLADVYLMATGAFTWEFSRRMAEGTQVYGGAGRVYPVGHGWCSDVSQAPLRFAFDAGDTERATRLLVSDMLRTAAAAGLLKARPAPDRLRRVTGTVKLVVAGRALVDIGSSLPAVVAEELTVEGVPIDRVLAPRQPVEGLFDPDTNRVDVTESLRPGDEALAAYEAGDVVLARVAEVRQDDATLTLYPRTTTPAVTVRITRSAVTSDIGDDLRTLLTCGEVVSARVLEVGPGWVLDLHDVDDVADEDLVTAPALLAGGPPWLVDQASCTGADHLDSAPAASPSPALLDRGRRRPAPAPAPDPGESTRTLLRKIDGLTARIGALTTEQDDLRARLLAGADERSQLRYLLDQAERRANRAEHELQAIRVRLRKAGSSRTTGVVEDGPQFADREQGFRYLVLTQWARRTLPGEQAARPLVDYAIGARFLDSLARLEGIKEEKVADVVFEVVTGLAPQLPGREVHHLRMGPGGDDPVRTREDGAVAWRASLQVRTPSARRLHFWVLPGGEIELARVTTHDDYDV